MIKKSVLGGLAMALVLASTLVEGHAATLTGAPAAIAPDATCLGYLGFYPGTWHARATAHSWIFWTQPGRMRVICGRTAG